MSARTPLFQDDEEEEEEIAALSSTPISLPVLIKPSTTPPVELHSPVEMEKSSHFNASNKFPCDKKENCSHQSCLNTRGGDHPGNSKESSPLIKSPSPSDSMCSYGSVKDQYTINPDVIVEEDVASRQSNRRDLTCQSPTGGPTLTVRLSPDVEESVRCGCHEKVVDHTTRKAVIKLLIASGIALFFMIGEVIGGYYANSLAIMTDAAHMLSDFAGFLISLFAIWISKRPPSRGMSFGWYRAEVIGALASVLVIWVLTGILLYEAVQRVIHRDFEVNSDIMLITACVGVFVNVFMVMVLHQHSHSHGGHGGHGHGNRESAGDTPSSRVNSHVRAENINVRAAFIHVIGDLVQSIGVVIAGYIISFWPSLKLADPICTFLFCILVFFSTFNILKDALRVVMEGTPKHIDYEEVKSDLNAIDGVKQAHSLHIWSLTLNRTALAAHLALDHGAVSDDVLERASKMLTEDHQITQITLQVERYQEAMDECGTCQEAERTSVLKGLIPSFLRRNKNP